MALQITGKVKEILSEKSGDGRNGHWSVQQFMVDISTINNGQVYEKEVAFDVWNNQLEIPKPGTLVTVSFNAESRRNNGYVNTSLRPYKIEKKENANQAVQQIANSQVSNAPQAPAQPQVPTQQPVEAPVGDDLPF